MFKKAILYVFMSFLVFAWNFIPVLSSISIGMQKAYAAVENQNPTVFIMPPLPPVSVLPPLLPFTINGNAFDPDMDPLTVSATIGGVTKTGNVMPGPMSGSWSLTWNTSEIPAGTYSNFLVTVSDGKGGMGTAPYVGTITVMSFPPVSSNADLSDLTITQGTLSPGFASGTTSYTANVGNEVNSIDITPTVADVTATLKVNGNAATSGSGVNVPLNVGANTVTVVITAQNGATKTYTIVLVRETISLAKPFVNRVTTNDTNVTGTTTPLSIVWVTLDDPTIDPDTTTSGTPIGFGIANADGTFSVPITGNGVPGSDQLILGHQYFVTAVEPLPGDPSMWNYSEPTLFKVAPSKPIVNEISDADAKITGTIDIGTILVVTVEASPYAPIVFLVDPDSSGHFEIQQNQLPVPLQAGIVFHFQSVENGGYIEDGSDEVTIIVSDKTSPSKPTVGEITDVDTKVSGTAEAGSTVKVNNGDTELGHSTVDIDGKFNFTIPKQQAGTVLVVVAEDAVGNRSAETTITIIHSSGGENGGGGSNPDRDRDRDRSDSGQTPPIPEQPSVVLTDIDGHWSEAKIKEAVQKGLVSGYPDGTFRPDTPLTRLQWISILSKGLQLQGEEAPISFTDVAQIPAWGREALDLAIGEEIISGYPDGSFRPDQEITRAEIVTTLARILKLETDISGIQIPFSDSQDIPAWASGSVAAMLKEGLIQGRGENQFAPKEPTTRAEAVVLILNALEKK